jgi:metal transporter CNNM
MFSPPIITVVPNNALDVACCTLSLVLMVEGALHMSTKVALDVFTPIRDVFSVPADMVLTEANLVKIYAAGFARVPVYLPGDNPLAICGILMTRYLIVVNSASSTEAGRSVSTLPLRIPQCVPPDMALVDLLNLLQHGGRNASAGGHLALVCARPYVAMAALAQPGGCVPEDAGLMGIVTLEDVLEMLLQEVRAWFHGSSMLVRVLPLFTCTR